jgi:hypothetical protein
METRLVKITDLLNDKIYYQIQKKTLLFGWVCINTKFNAIKSTFDNLEEAKKHYIFFTSGENHKIETIL